MADPQVPGYTQITNSQGAFQEQAQTPGTQDQETLVPASSGGGTPSGPAGGDLAGTYPNPTLAPVGPGATGPIGSTTTSAVITIDAKGRVTGLTSANIAVGGSGTVTTVSVATANGFSGTVANAATTPAITLSTSVTGVLKGAAGALAAATAGTDFVAPGGALGTPSSGNLANCTFPTLNQNTTGTAANLSGTPALPNGTTATTQAPGDATTKIATDAFVAAAITAAPMSGLYTTSTITADPNPGVVGTYYRANYAAAGNFTLPSTGLTTGQWVMVKQVAANTLTIVGTVDGNASYTLVQYDSVTFVWNGTNWDAN